MTATLANRTSDERSGTDFYPTPDAVIDAIVDYLNLPKSTLIWEPAAGEGHIARRLNHHGYQVISTDMYDRGHCPGGSNFLTEQARGDFILTNPPFGLAHEFIEHAIGLRMACALLLKSQFWHARARLPIFHRWRPKAVLPLTWRPDFLFGARGGGVDNGMSLDCLGRGVCGGH